jgi:hypothetical protein
MSLFTKFAPLAAALLSAVSVSASTLKVLASTEYTWHISMENRHRPPMTAVTTPPQLPATSVALNVYPNPSQGIVTIVLTDQTTGPAYKMRLRNIIGQEVRTVALHPQFSGVGLTLDLSDLPAGLYFYSLLVDNKAVLTKRLTLQ